MNDAEKLISIPEEIIFESYLQRIIDHLSLVYDPEYSSQEILSDGSTTVMQYIYGAYTVRNEIPEMFQHGINLIEYAKSLLSKEGKIKNLGYLPFLAYFACYSRGSHGTVENFSIPEEGENVTPERIGIAAERFPEIHGVSSLDKMTVSPPDQRSLAKFMFPMNLNGDPVWTYPKYQMAKSFDRLLDVSNAILHREYPFFLLNKPDFYKKTDMYCVWNLKTMVNGGVKKECTSTNFRESIYGTFGWFKDNYGDLVRENLLFRLEIYSKSLFRYKFVVVCRTDPSYGSTGYGTCKYDFAESKFSVIYESPDWITGDCVWEYDFEAGSRPSGDTQSEIYLSYPAVIIYPEYPDRLKELLKK